MRPRIPRRNAMRLRMVLVGQPEAEALPKLQAARGDVGQSPRRARGLQVRPLRSQVDDTGRQGTGKVRSLQANGLEQPVGARPQGATQGPDGGARMKTYTGRRDITEGLCVVLVDGEPLDPRLDIRRHSPAGFEWGYAGSGPAQLALAILADHLQDRHRAERLYQDYKRLVVAALPREAWSLTSAEVALEVQALETVLTNNELEELP